MKQLWGRLLCWIGVHDGTPVGITITCDRCGETMVLSRVIKIGRYKEGKQ